MASSEFRRTAAMAFLDAGGYADGLQALMGWESAQMLRHYTKATAAERAVPAHKRVSPSDRLRLHDARQDSAWSKSCVLAELGVWPGLRSASLDKQRGGPVEAACAVSGGVACCCICDLSATYPRLGGHCYYRPHLL